ncbi:MAG: cell division protein SepF [Halobacteriales archaeon]
MSLVNKLLGQEQQRNINEYEEIDIRQYEDEMGRPEAAKNIHIAELTGQEGVMDVKDLVYDGEIVLADVSHFRNSERRFQNVMEEFRRVTQEVGGDIVQKGDSQLIITPRGVGISREKITR